MMRIFSYLFSFLVLGLGTVSAQGVISLTDLKQKVREGLVEVNEDLFVEGVVINIFACGNLEVARNDTYTSLSTSDDNRTMYVQSFDGNEGIGLHFIASKFANVPQCSKVRVNLKGTHLKFIRGVGLSAYDLGESAVVSVEPGTRDDIVVKEKTVAGLTDNDVKWWSDSYETAAKKSGATMSYNAFNSPTGKYRIDYIYHRGNIQVKEFCINNKLYDNLYPSDHFPLWADITISR